MYKIGAIFFVITLMVACKPNKEPDLNLGYNYFPLQVGNTYIYQVDSIAFSDNNNSSDTFVFEVKQEIDSIIVNQQNQPIYVFTQSVRNADTLPWIARTNLFIQLTNNQLIVNNQNNVLVKLVFPIGNVKSWDGNMYNQNFRQTYTLQYYDETIANNTSCKVQEILNINSIENEQRYTIYHKNVGMVEHFDQYLNTQIQGTLGYKVTYYLKSFKLK